MQLIARNLGINCAEAKYLGNGVSLSFIDENIDLIHVDAFLIVKKDYDEGSREEWNRLEEHPFEFLITVKIMERYIKTGDSILDIGGGPGRYSLYFAKKDYDDSICIM